MRAFSLEYAEAHGHFATTIKLIEEEKNENGPSRVLDEKLLNVSITEKKYTKLTVHTSLTVIRINWEMLHATFKGYLINTYAIMYLCINQHKAYAL